MKPDPLIGAVIDGKYTISELIGSGGMGAVYRAQHNYMERTVAIKVLSLRDLDGTAEEYLRRFKHEAQTASQIRHPSAIAIYDYGIAEIGGTGDRPYLVMEYVEGVTLKSLIREGTIHPNRLVPLMLQVCGALEEAHRLGIVHRDLKPDNIMISPRGDTERAHVLDFGIAKVVTGHDSVDAGMTKTGSVIGTPRYMSPEQILSKPVDQRADIYALGLVIYESLTGDVPFTSPSIMELAIKHVS
ncbi:MAG: serine/threonine protein kinase, partial [Bdellovibrionales bacterium]|nr:serine/threonine protein kinase [Bdellovibrionales bacterium]